jgi:hypothetical protein
MVLKPGWKLGLSPSIGFGLQHDAAFATASSVTNVAHPGFNGDARDIESAIGAHNLG